MDATPPTYLASRAQKRRLAYNAGVPLPKVSSSNLLLNIAAYITIASVGFVGWFAVDDPVRRWLALALVIAFAALNLYFDTDQGRRDVRIYFAAQTVMVVILSTLDDDSSLFNVLFFILSAQSMLTLSPRRALLWIGIFCILTGLVSVVRFGWVGILYVLPNFGGYTFFATFGNSLRVVNEEKTRSQQLLEELRAAQTQLQELAIAEERNRLAREMHDSLGHRLTVAVVQLEGAQRLIPIDPERASRMIGAMREHMKEALADLRRTVAAMRMPREDHLALDAALARLVKTFQEGTGLTVHLDLQTGLPALPDTHRLALYRAAQESLTNAQRHANARQVWLNICAESGRIILTAADDGQGFPQPNDLNGGGSGLRGLQERAAQLGGELHRESRTGGGGQVRFVLPVGDQPIIE